jgi:hypothetical protein
MMIDEKTTRNYPLPHPHPENIAKHDVARIREAFVAVDADINAIETVITTNNIAAKSKKFEEFIKLWSEK